MPINNNSDNLFDTEAPLDDETLWDLLSLYVDGEADPAQAAIVEQMLSSDPAYRRDFDFLMQSSKTMHMVEEVEPPIGLRDAVYAKVNRPTLVGRLRAAWSRATTPTFGRYAAAGGAFAVAALGAVIAWPHMYSASNQGTSPTQIANRSTQVSPEMASNSYRVPDLPLPTFTWTPHINAKRPEPKLVKIPSAMKQPRLPNVPTPVKADVSKEVSKTTVPPLRNHPLQRNGSTHNDSSLTLTKDTSPHGYPYDKKMDDAAAHGRTATIFTPGGNDIGPMVVASEETTTRTTVPTTTVTPTNPVQDTPKPAVTTPRVRVATLPPDASQNIANAVLRHDSTAKYIGYNRTTAENIQRHEITFDLVKGSF